MGRVTAARVLRRRQRGSGAGVRRVLLCTVHVPERSGTVVLRARTGPGRLFGRRHRGRQTDHARQPRVRHAGRPRHQSQRTPVHNICRPVAVASRFCGRLETDNGRWRSLNELDVLEILSETYQWNEG